MNVNGETDVVCHLDMPLSIPRGNLTLSYYFSPSIWTYAYFKLWKTLDNKMIKKAERCLKIKGRKVNDKGNCEKFVDFIDFIFF